MSGYEFYRVCRAFFDRNESSILLHHIDVFGTENETLVVVPWMSPMQNRWSLNCLASCGNGTAIRSYYFPNQFLAATDYAI